MKIIMYNGNAKRADLLKILRSRIAWVTFTKVNGEERIMKCSLVPRLLPEAVTNNGRGFHTPTTGTISVWDLGKDDWRAFRVDSVIEVRYNDLYPDSN